MAVVDSGSKRNLTVLAVVVACFAVLWPKVFYPMIYSILMPSGNEEDIPEIQDSIKKLHKMLHPQMREAMGEARPFDKEQKDKNRIFLHPFMRHSAKPQSKGAGAVNLVIPVYTIAIILFFIYSLFKMMLKKNSETCQSVSVKPRKTNCIHKCTEVEEHLEKRKVNAHERKTHRVLEQYGKEKVLTALKTIILEMEDFKGNFSEMDVRPISVPDALGSTFNSSP